MCGRVLDQQDKPVADAGISFYWNVNGVTLEELQKFERDGGDDTMFSIKGGIERSNWIHTLLAITKQQKRGVLIVLDAPP